LPWVDDESPAIEGGSFLIRSYLGATSQNASLLPAAGDKNAHADCHHLVQSAQRKPSVPSQPPGSLHNRRGRQLHVTRSSKPKSELRSHCQWPLGGRRAPSGQAGASSDGHFLYIDPMADFVLNPAWPGVRLRIESWMEYWDSDSLSKSCPGVGCPSMFSVSDRTASCCDLMGDLVALSPVRASLWR
jgi:hypothetical protein